MLYIIYGPRSLASASVWMNSTIVDITENSCPKRFIMQEFTLFMHTTPPHCTAYGWVCVIVSLRGRHMIMSSLTVADNRAPLLLSTVAHCWFSIRPEQVSIKQVHFRLTRRCVDQSALTFCMTIICTAVVGIVFLESALNIFSLYRDIDQIHFISHPMAMPMWERYFSNCRLAWIR